ncbi:MAG: hypothetical protein IKF97_05770 [Clostridia bacterium]|nr:hypothetical protein [Clostridia bacterium]
MIIIYSREEEKEIPDIKEKTKKLFKRTKKTAFQNGEAINIKNKEINKPGIILYVDDDVVSKYRYLVAKLSENQAHWYSSDELETIEDEKLKNEVIEWYKYNKAILQKENKQSLYAV